MLYLRERGLSAGTWDKMGKVKIIMKITKQQELDHIVSITSGLLASGHFTYLRQDGRNSEVRTEVRAMAYALLSQIWTDQNVTLVRDGEDNQPERKGRDK
jgi:hypothetical protein